MTHRLLIPREACTVAAVGGKAAGLARLVRLGLEVPPFVVLGPEAMSAAPDACAAATDAAWEALGGGPLAVRSSGLDEDGSSRSFAGQHETVLHLTRRADLPAAVARVQASGGSERALAYRRQAGIAAPAQLAVIIQRMVAPEVSGVAFSVDPANGRDDHLVISALWGLGEGLVSGALDADTWTCDHRGRVLRCQVAEKVERFSAADDGGVRREPVPAELVARPCLEPAALAVLAEAVCRIAEDAGTAQDVEFAFCAGRLVLLQARPVTAVQDATDLPGPMIYDNSNIVESYPGVTSPLTFSFIRRAYRAVYWQFCQLLGLRPGEIRRQQGMLGNMLAHVHGRVYYQLLNWYRLIALLPGFSHNRRFMEGMMGASAVAAMPAAVRPPSWGRLLTTGLHALRLHRHLPASIRAFHARMARILEHHRRIDLDAQSPQELLALYHGLEREVLWHWQAPIVNDFEAMICNGLARRLAVAWGLDNDGWMINALIAGQGRIESTEVSRRLLELAARCADDPDLARTLDAEPSAALAALRVHPRTGPLVEAFLAGYGDRCAEELKLESRSLHDEPERLVALLRSYRDLGLDRARTATVDDSGRQARAALRALPGRCAGGLLRRRTVLTWAIDQARRAVRNRENQRIERTRAFALVRRILRAIARHWQAEGRLLREDDVFYLSVEEIEQAVTGAIEPPLRERVRRRRQREARDRQRSDPPDRIRVDVGGEDAAPPTAVAGVLRGLGAYPGRVEARAAVLTTPDLARVADRPILVARSTDPGWVVVFPAIAGLVAERGSMLSHAAIVARELGIPAVVGVRGAADLIPDGSRLRLDGGAGTVAMVEDA